MIDLNLGALSETTIQWISIAKIILIAVFSGLYGFGGMRGKWKRRYIAPFIYVIGVSVFSLWTSSFSWWYLAVFPLLVASLSIGYGAIKTVDKIIRRSRFGMACSLASLPIFWVHEAWTLLILHILLCVLVSTIAGVWNQTSSARAEESLIGASIVFVPLFVI